MVELSGSKLSWCAKDGYEWTPSVCVPTSDVIRMELQRGKLKHLFEPPWCQITIHLRDGTTVELVCDGGTSDLAEAKMFVELVRAAVTAAAPDATAATTANANTAAPATSVTKSPLEKRAPKIQKIACGAQEVGASPPISLFTLSYESAAPFRIRTQR